MNKFLKYFLFSLTFVLFGLLVGFKINSSTPKSTRYHIDEGLRKLHQTLLVIENNYVEEPNHDKLVDDAIKGILEGLDPHSFYIPATERKQMQEQLDGSFDGIGIAFDIIEDTIYVERALPGGPSEALGIQAGDRIVKVDGKVVAGIKITNLDVMKYLKGPKGTKVHVSIKRRGFSEYLEFDIVRDKIPNHSVEEGYMLNDEIGYIRATRFAETTHLEFKEQLRKLKDQGMKNLVLDLRGNPGGYLIMAERLADEFLSSGKLIVSTDGRVPQSKKKYRSTSSIASFEEGGLVILLNYESASASEIVAGAVQDHDRGLIVGVRSFGKGLVQTQEDFDDGSAMRIVISKYYTPSGRCIQKPYKKSSREYDKEIAERFASGEIFDKTKVTFPDSLKYSTASGRTVYGGGGIFPDVFVPDDTSGNSKYFTDLRIKDLFRAFAADYVDNRPNLKNRYKDAPDFVENFTVNSSLIKTFTSFAAKKGVPYVDADYQESKKYIDNRIKAFIGRRLHNDLAFYPVFYQLDNVLQRAVELMPSAIELEETGDFSLRGK